MQRKLVFYFQLPLQSFWFYSPEVTLEDLLNTKLTTRSQRYDSYQASLLTFHFPHLVKQQIQLELPLSKYYIVANYRSF